MGIPNYAKEVIHGVVHWHSCMNIHSLRPMLIAFKGRFVQLESPSHASGQADQLIWTGGRMQ